MEDITMKYRIPHYRDKIQPLVAIFTTILSWPQERQIQTIIRIAMFLSPPACKMEGGIIPKTLLEVTQGHPQRG